MFKARRFLTTGSKMVQFSICIDFQIDAAIFTSEHSIKSASNSLTWGGKSAEHYKWEIDSPCPRTTEDKSEAVQYNSSVQNCVISQTEVFHLPVALFILEQILGKKATIHQVTTILATSRNVQFPGHNNLLTTGIRDGWDLVSSISAGIDNLTLLL